MHICKVVVLIRCYNIFEVYLPYETSCSSVGKSVSWSLSWSVVGRSVRISFLKRQGSYTSMLLSEHLFYFYKHYPLFLYKKYPLVRDTLSYTLSSGGNIINIAGIIKMKY